jgi:fucose permease
MGLLTALYGLGQIVGPPLASALLQRHGGAATGFTLSLAVAAAALVVGALVYVGMARVFPRPGAPGPGAGST